MCGYLNRLKRSFYGLAEIGEMSLYWVFEVNKSPSFDSEAKKVVGPEAILVVPDSATAYRVNGSGSGPRVHPIARNHSGLVKFTRSGQNTGPIIEVLRRLCGLNEVIGGATDEVEADLKVSGRPILGAVTASLRPGDFMSARKR